eukprot:996005-Amphidinium_carterae.1
MSLWLDSKDVPQAPQLSSESKSTISKVVGVDGEAQPAAGGLFGVVHAGARLTTGDDFSIAAGRLPFVPLARAQKAVVTWACSGCAHHE